MRTKKRIRILALTLVLLLALAPCASAEFAAYVKSKSMKVYDDQGMTQSIGALKKKTVVVVDSYSDGIAKIIYQNKKGYAAISDMKEMGGEAKPMVVTTNTRVYKKASNKGKGTALSKGTKVNLLATSGSCALVERNGYIGYTYVKHLAVEGQTTPSEPSNVTVETFEAVVKSEKLVVYKKNSTSSKKIGTLRSSAKVTVCAYTDKWARLENDGVYGFCLRSGLDRVTTEITPPKQEEEDPPQTTATFEDAVASGKYSNEELIFLFLTKQMKLNTAAACGILSNIKSESTFRPTAYNSSGGSYGLCQWTGNRYTRLKSFCSDKGYDYKTITGQMYYLEHELKNYYSKTLSYIRNVSDNSSGAYDAAYYWCYNFEVPANRASVSVKRGNTASGTYWLKYT